MPGFELIGREELEEIEDVFRHGGVLFRHGFEGLRQGVYKVRDFEAAFAAYMGAPDALAVTSGSAALRVALAALGVGRGDEVVTQSFTFVATVEAIIEAGATPVCTDIDDTLNMDPVSLDAAITSRTKAIIPVHMLGSAARLDRIGEIASRRGIPIVEDTAWGCGGTYRGRHLGTVGAIGTFSFDHAKAITTGEGGMLLCADAGVAARARAWHDHGHENNPALPRWEDSRKSSGFNYRMSELQGAVGLAQLRKLSRVLDGQRRTFRALQDAVADLPGLTFRTVPDGSEGTADALIFFVADRDTAGRCRSALVQAGLGTKILPEAMTWHFAGSWSHMSELQRAHGGDLEGAFARSRALLERAVALPVLAHMDPSVPGRTREALGNVLR